MSDDGSNKMDSWGKVQANWKQLKGKVKEQWGELTDDEITQIDGIRDQLIGKIEERYHIAKDEAEKQVDVWVAKL